MPQLLRILAITCVVATVSCTSEAPQPTKRDADDKRNVVLFILDTLRADVMSSYGYPLETSPELDALAEKGVRFDYVVAPSSWTRPSIGEMITGLYPRTLGLYDEEGEILADGFTTLAEVLQANGYATIGLTANPVINSVFNMHQGFDTYIDSHIVFSWMGAGEGEVTARNRQLRPTPDILRQAEQLIDEAGNKPVYLQLNLMEMHEYWRSKLHLIRDEYLDEFPEETHVRRRRYLQSLRQLSHDVSGFIEKLQQRPGWENALFVITADHGEGLESHPDVIKSDHHGRLIYASHVRVPWIIYSADLPVSQQTVTQPVRLLDAMPTILDLLGVEVPSGVEGTSLVSVLQGAGQKSAAYHVTETHFRNYEKIAVYSEAWAYIDNRDPHNRVPRFELQSLSQNENGAKTNAIEANPETAEKLKKYLSEWESAHPLVPATPATAQISDDERDQLKAIGYLE